MAAYSSPPPSSPKEPSATSSNSPIDDETFQQILELDDDGCHTYSRDMFALYFVQAPEAFSVMKTALADKDMELVADRAHFIAGSSATLGIVGVADACTRIEGVSKDSSKDDLPPATLRKIEDLLSETRLSYLDARAWLRDWYKKHGEPFDEPESNKEGASPSKSEDLEGSPPKVALADDSGSEDTPRPPHSTPAVNEVAAAST